MKKSFGKKAFKRVLCLFMAVLLLATSSPIVRFDLFFKAGAAVSGNAADDDSSQDLNILNSNEKRIDMKFDKNWSFFLGDESGARLRDYKENDSWKKVSLPHDYSITQAHTTSGNTEPQSGMLPGGTAWYRKMFTLPSGLNSKELVLNFGGVYKDAYVYVNGTLVCENHYGYNEFSVNITNYVIADGRTANLIAVKVEDQLPNSRFYAGAGIYRSVSITATEKVHVFKNGLLIKPEVTGSGTNQTITGKVTGEITVHNDLATREDITAKVQIFKNGTEASTEVSKTVNVDNGAKTKITVDATVSNPSLWNLETPNLYTYKVSLYIGDTLYDTYSQDFGFRTIYFDQNNGFYLNNRPVKLQGVCMHSDQGGLGSIQVYDAIYRQVIILKDMGVNAIRTSHNIPSIEFMNICSELGMLVVDEFFDGWYSEKEGNSQSFHKDFNTTINAQTNKLLDVTNGDTWGKFTLQTSIKRDRNNPAVIAWSFGNELSDTELSDTNTATQIRNWTNEVDGTRKITIGSNGNGFSNAERVFDLKGINYNTEYRDNIANAAKNADKSVYLSETASAVMSRGFYKIYNDARSYAGEAYQITSYDLVNTNINGWGEQSQAAWWSTITHNDYAGEFIWTGFDYLGEPTPWNNINPTNASTLQNPNSSYFGVIDTAGYAKDSYYLYRSWWNKNSNTLHMLPGTWDQSKLTLDTNNFVYVPVYSNAKTVRLYLNGQLIGTAVSTENTANTPSLTNDSHKYLTWTETSNNTSLCNVSEQYTGTGKDLFAQFKVKYTAGTLSVKAWDKNNQEITSTAVGTKSISSSVTASTATTVVPTVWSDKEQRIPYYGDGGSYAYVELEAQDANGNFVNDFNGSMKVNLTGPATIAAFDNGYQWTKNKHQQSSVFPNGDRLSANVTFFNGRALVILKTNDNAQGTVELVQDPNDQSSVHFQHGVTIEVLAESQDSGRTLDEFEEICPQNSEIIYNPSVVERYENMQNLVADLGIAGSNGSNREFSAVPSVHNYELYTPFDSTEKAIAEGSYILYSEAISNYANSSVLLSAQNADRGNIKTVPYAAENGKIVTSDVHSFTFTNCGSNIYYVQNSQGKYLSLTNDGIALVDRATKLNVRVSNNKVVLYQANDNNGANCMELASGSANSPYVKASANGSFSLGTNGEPSGTALASYRLFSLYRDRGEAVKVYDKYPANVVTAIGNQNNVTYQTSTTPWDGTGTVVGGETTETRHLTNVPEGWYAIYGESTDTAHRTKGALTATTATGGGALQSSGEAVTGNSPVWYFDKLSENENDHTYNIYTIVGGARKYLRVDNNVSVGDSAMTLIVTLTNDKITIKNSSTNQWLLYSHLDGASNKVGAYSSGTSLSLYTADENGSTYSFNTSSSRYTSFTSVPEGWFALWAGDGANRGIMTSQAVTGRSGYIAVGLTVQQCETVPSSGQAWHIERVQGTNYYHISTYNSDNELVYLNITGTSSEFNANKGSSKVLVTSEPMNLLCEVTTVNYANAIAIKNDGGIALNIYPDWKRDDNQRVDAKLMAYWTSASPIQLFQSSLVENRSFTVNHTTPWTSAYQVTVPGGTTTTNVNFVPNGWYAMYGSNETGSYKGVVTSNALETEASGNKLYGLIAAGHDITTTDQAWYFTRVDETNNLYTIATYQDGKVVFLNINGDSTVRPAVTVSSFPQNLKVEKGTNGQITVKNEYNVGFNYRNDVIAYCLPTETQRPVTIYPSNTTAPIPADSETKVVEDGKYIIYNGSSSAVMSNVEDMGKVLTSASEMRNAHLKTSQSNEYTFTHVFGNDYTVMDSNGKYVFIENGVITLSNEPKIVTLTGTSDHNVFISNGDSYLALDTDSAPSKYVSLNGFTETNSKFILSVYKESTDTTLSAFYNNYTDPKEYTLLTADKPIEDGAYVIKFRISSTDYVMTSTQSASSGVGAKKFNTTPDNSITGDKLVTSSNNEFTITYVSTNDDGTNNYYVQRPNGDYLNIALEKTNVSFTPTPTTLIIGRTGDKVYLRNSSDHYYMDVYTSEEIWSNWKQDGRTDPNDNEKFDFYYLPSTSQKTGDSASVGTRFQALADALHRGTSIENYTMYNIVSLTELVEALEDGYNVYNNSGSSDAEIAAAVERINSAIEALSSSITYFPATYYKYGFDKVTSDNYKERYNGQISESYNNKHRAEMKSILLTEINLRTQIENIVDGKGADGVATITYADDAARQTAIEKVAERYSVLYTLAFTGAATTGENDNPTTDASQSGWNCWEKESTKGHDFFGAEEAKNEGASVQGIFSSVLGPDGYPVSHTAYDVLPYVNSGTKGHILAPVTVSVTTSSGNQNVTLPALQNVSPYVGELFQKEDVFNDLTTDVTTDYYKYYWDTTFPFVVSTDSYGVSTYEYNSSDPDHTLRAYYDDETNTAITKLTDGQATYNLHQASAGHNTGFFPFNYQLTREQAESDEKIVTNISSGQRQDAIYHFGMQFSTEFYMPPGARYTNGEDITFNFSGDDDVLVYVDGKLILDNGGLHGARSASINFTDCSVSYQYVADLYDASVNNTDKLYPKKVPGTNNYAAENQVIYKYGNENGFATSPDAVAATDYLHQIMGDGMNHTLSFYYLERGSTESNCGISFNMQPLTGTAKLNPQTLVSDFGLDIEYNVDDNNSASVKKDDKFYYEYIGVIEAGHENNLPTIYTRFDYDKSLMDAPINKGKETVFDGKYGTFTADSTGIVKFKHKDMKMTGPDTFYMLAEVHGDPLYTASTVYVAYEEVTILPATTIYYEDNYEGTGDGNGITYVDGVETSVATGYDYGKWEEVTDGTTPIGQQAADLVGSPDRNVYGYDPVYANFPKYSNGSSHKVSVSEVNAGNSNRNWPYATFTFTGTGFDIVSLTSKETGVFTITATNTQTNEVKKKIVDTYYGYSYGQICRTSDGQPTLTQDGNTVMYKTISEKATDDGSLVTNLDRMTAAKTYYDNKGKVVSDVWYYDADKNSVLTPHYYDENGDITETVTENPAYAYAYAMGWLQENDAPNVELYQIPVLRLIGLTYGTWNVKVEARYTQMFGHNSLDKQGNAYYDLYLDGVRIYEPAGPATADGGTSSNTVVSEAYETDREAFVYFSQIKDMIIGADTIDANGHEGALFIDGRDTVKSNELDAYLKAGPNNELYLDGGQAVAFEIWTTTVPTDVQVGLKMAKKGASANQTQEVSPAIDIMYRNDTTLAKPIETSTAMNYSFNSMLDSENKLTWEIARDDSGNPITDENGRTYYSTGTIVLKNDSSENNGAILSVTNIKWTFTTYGSTGFYKIPTKPQDEIGTAYVLKSTRMRAMRMLSAKVADVAIDESTVTTDQSSEDGTVTIKFETSTDVNEIVVKDKNGNPINLDKVESVVNKLDSGEKKQWTVTLTESEAGTYTYTIMGVYDQDYTGDSKPIEVTVTVTAPEEITPPTVDDGEDKPNDGDDSSNEENPPKENFFQKIISTLKSIIDKILALFGIVRG